MPKEWANASENAGERASFVRRNRDNAEIVAFSRLFGWITPLFSGQSCGLRRMPVRVLLLGMDTPPPGDKPNRMLTTTLCVLVAALGFVYVFITFKGLDSPNAMDQAQIARELARGHGFRTLMIRPAALHEVMANEQDATLTQQADTYHPPLQSLIWAPVFKGLESWWKFDTTRTVYVMDRVIASIGVVWYLLTLLLTHGMARRLFDRTVAGFTVLCLALSPQMWQVVTCSGSRGLLLFLFTLTLYWLTGMMRRAQAGEPVGVGLVCGVGLACALMVMTHWMAVFLVIGVIASVALLVPRQRPSSIVVALFPVAALVGWALRNKSACGGFMGAGKALLQSVLSPQGAALQLRDFENAMPPVYMDSLIHKLGLNINAQMQDLCSHLAGVIPALVFFLCLLHRFRKPEVQAMRWVLLLVWGFAWVGMAMFGLPSKAADDNQIHCVFVPALAMFGLAALAVFWARLHTGKGGLWHTCGPAIVAVCITAWPMVSTLPSEIKMGLFRKNQLMNWPTYQPITLSYLTRWVKPEEVLASDSPWSVAWYADRTCVWLPKDTKQFDAIRAMADKQAHHMAGIVFTPLATADEVAGVAFSGSYAAWADWLARGPVRGLGPDLASALKPLQAFPIPQSLGSIPLPDGRIVPCTTFYTDSTARLPRHP